MTELFEVNLRDRFQEARGKGTPGLPRRQLLDWLWPVAEALDEVDEKQSLDHLAVTPRTIVFKGTSGAVDRVWPGALALATGRPVAGPDPDALRRPRGGRDARHPCSDQYSLAMIFQEMLTGEHPSPRPAAR